MPFSLFPFFPPLDPRKESPTTGRAAIQIGKFLVKVLLFPAEVFGGDDLHPYQQVPGMIAVS